MSTEKQLTYDGVEFVIDEQFWFGVPSLDQRWQSYAEMTEGIDKSRKAIESHAREKLSLKCVDSECNAVTVTGIHAGRGQLLVTPKRDSSRYGIYPDVGWIREALEASRDVEDRLARIRDALKGLALESVASYAFNPVYYADYVANLKQQYATVEKITGETTFGDLVDASTAKRI